MYAFLICIIAVGFPVLTALAIGWVFREARRDVAYRKQLYSRLEDRWAK